jgi:hypothetical protein
MERAVRAAETEAIFRDVNETVVGEQHSGPPDAEIAVLCECSNDTCAESLSVSRLDYERVRAVATQFLVVPEHLAPEIEVVVERDPGWWVIEKVEQVAVGIAEDTDPRS